MFYCQLLLFQPSEDRDDDDEAQENDVEQESENSGQLCSSISYGYMYMDRYLMSCNLYPIVLNTFRMFSKENISKQIPVNH